MSLRMNHTQTSKRLSGMVIVSLLMLLLSSAAYGQFSGQCTREIFVGAIAGHGGTAVGIAMDAQDNLYIANNVGASIPGPIVSKVTPQGVISTVVPLGILGDVTALAVDAQGNLYVADGNGNGNGGQPLPKNMVWKVDSSGSITPFVLGVNNPTGLAFDLAQNLYVSSYTDRSVYKYSTTGTFLGVATSNLQEAPYGIAVDASGNLFVGGFSANGAVPAGAWGQRIYVVTPQGQRSVFVDPGFPDPYSLVFDKQGYLYASYYNGLKILRIAPDGSYTTFPGGCVGDDAANGLAIDSNGTLYAVVNGGRTTAQQAVLKIYGVVPGTPSPSSFLRLFIPGNMLLAAESPSGSVVNYTTTALDEHFAPAAVTCSYPPGSVFPIGTTPVTCTAIDGAGNFSAPGTFYITVVDGPPNLSLPPGVSATPTSSAGAQVSYSVSAYDAVSGELPVHCSPVSGSTFPIGTTTVNCSATDEAGNTATGSFEVALTGAKSYGACISSEFVSPVSVFGGTATGLAFDAQDNLYIAENVNNGGITPQGPLVSKVTPQGARSIFVPQGILGDVTDLVVDSQGNLYVADGRGYGGGQPAANNMVWKVRPNGSITPFILGINNPTGLALDSAQNLYVSSYDDMAVYKYSLTGAFLGAVIQNLPDASYDIAVDASGNVLVASFALGTDESSGQRIYKVTPQGQLSQFFFDGGQGQPHSLVFDNQGYLYASYYGTLKIIRIAPDGSYSIFPGGCVDDDAPNGLAIDSHGFLYTVVNGGRTTEFATVLKIFGIVPASGSVSLIPEGTNVVVQTDTATFTFDDVTSGGTTTLTPIDAASVGQVPGGFAVSNSVAYEIATTATFTGSVTLAFKVPGPISQTDFNSLAILHSVNGTLVDVTATTPARNYSTLTIYATTNSFSPFYLARRGPHIKTLFDQTKAQKRGSTIPIKLQVLSASNINVSSSGAPVVTRDLRLMSGNTLAPIEDSGNANPDYTFRYDSTLGGTGGGYIFNLSTKGLAAGQYVLSFYVGNDRSFFYTVKFEVR